MAAFALVAVAASSAGAYAAERPSPGPAKTAPDTLEPATLSAADLAQLKAHTVLEKASLPGGVRYQHLEVNDDKSVTVVVTADSARSKSAVTAAALEKNLQSAAVDLKVDVKVAAISDQRLDAAADEAFATLKQWAGDLAPLVNRIGPDHNNGSVIIGSVRDSAELKARARAHFDLPLRFDVAGIATTKGRYKDTAPWSAGNALTAVASEAGQQPATCTQGFSWRKSDGITYGSTAGHCFQGNQSVFNGNPNQRIGYVSARWYANDGPTDVELIRPTVGSFDDTVWLGGPNTSDLRVVSGADNVNSDVNKDKTVCFSGANGGTNCGAMKLFHQRIQITDPSSGLTHWTRGLTCVNMPSSSKFTGGDSGGPVLSTKTDGTAFAWGQIVAGVTDENGHPAGDCAGIFTPVVVISATVGATLAVRS